MFLRTDDNKYINFNGLYLRDNNNINIINSDLQLYYDASNSLSYSGGDTWFNLGNKQMSDGTLINGVGYTNEYGGGLVFNGVDSYVEGPIFEPESYTFSIWYKATGIPGLNDNYGGALLTSSRLLFQKGYYISHSWNDQLISYHPKINTPYNINNIFNNTVYNVTVVYDNNNIKIFINDQLLRDASYVDQYSYPTTGYRNLNIGTWAYNGRYFNGNIYSVSMYDRGLSESEVLYNFNKTRTRFNI